ncbi:MAG: TolC family protein [Treponema sp.]|jgi:outer membrane protein TolC|nr:TolC family protein [Treponema sp.]
MNVVKRLLKRLFYLACLTASIAVYAEPHTWGVLSFAEAAELAVAHSAELRNGFAQKKIQEGRWRLSLRAYFPRLSIGASEDDRLSQTSADSFQKNYTLGLDQLLWDGGRTGLSRKLERAELNLLGSQLEMSVLETAEAAITAYRQILTSREIIKIRRAAFESLSEQRRILAEELRLGRALPLDLIDADISVSEARIELLSLGIELEEIERQFAESLGLEALPPLGETVDIRRTCVLPSPEAARAQAEENSPRLAEARHAVRKKEAELKAASISWIPTLRISGNFALTGQRYPLTRHNWSVGLTLELSTPFLSTTVNAQAGWEPPFDRNARLQNTLSPLPEPAEALTRKSAEAALALEKTNYETVFRQAGRAAETAVEKCRLLERKRNLALESIELGAERLRLSELRLRLGQLTRLELMEAQLDYTQSEIAAVEAASALLEAERELERFLNLRPGELNYFAETWSNL